MSVAFPELRATRCVRFRYRHSECQRCQDACPHEAVVLADDGVRVDPARCQNCGLCVGACRTEALASPRLARVETLKRAIRQERFAWACDPSGLEGDATVPCLGALDGATLAYLAKRGIAVELRGSGHCAECPHGARGASQLALVLDAAQALRAASGEKWAEIKLAASSSGRVAGRTPAQAERRQLLRRLIGRAIHEVAEADEHGNPPSVPKAAIRAGSPFITEQRELLQIVCKRSDGAAFRLGRHDGLPLMQLGPAQGCTACEACFRVCPTGALQIEETTVSWTLSFTADRCIGCEACIEVCQPGALDAEDEFDAHPARGAKRLERRAKQRCARCDRFFVSAEPQETCQVCLDDEQAFSAILG